MLYQWIALDYIAHNTESKCLTGTRKCVVLGVLVTIIVAWIVMPFVIFSRLRAIADRVEHARISAKFSAEKLAAIEKHAADVAAFVNERNVKIES